MGPSNPERPIIYYFKLSFMEIIYSSFLTVAFCIIDFFMFVRFEILEFGIFTFSGMERMDERGNKISEFVFVLLRPSFNYQIMGILSMFLCFGKMTKLDSQKRNI